MGEKSFVQMTMPDYDEIFTRTNNAILLNDLLIDKRLGEILRLVYDDDTDNPSVVASCPYGCTVASYYNGTKCEHCGEMVTDDNGSQIRHDVWFRSPRIIGKILHPHAYRVLHKWMPESGGVKLLDMILDRRVEVPEKWQHIVTGQGFVWFYNNFDSIIDQVMMLKRGSKEFQKNLEIKLFIEYNREQLWCTHMPLVSRILHPLIKSAGNRYVSKVTDTLVKAIDNLAFAALSETLLESQLPSVEKKFFVVYKTFNTYLHNMIKDSVSPKSGIARKHIFGSRTLNTVRTVCVPIIEPHDLDEIHLAWAPGVKLLQSLLISMLVNHHGYKPFQAYQKTERAIAVYDFEIDKLMQKLISSSKYKGIPIILNRNPVLRITGLLQLFITKIYPANTRDPEKRFERMRRENPDMTDEELGIDTEIFKLTSNKTLALPPEILGGPNADLTLGPLYRNI